MYLNQFNDQMHFLSWKNKVLFNGTNKYLPLLSGSELVTRVIAKDCGGVNISPIITKEVPNDPLSKLFWNGQATCWKCQGMIQRFGGGFFLWELQSAHSIYNNTSNFAKFEFTTVEFYWCIIFTNNMLHVHVFIEYHKQRGSPVWIS